MQQICHVQKKMGQVYRLEVDAAIGGRSSAGPPGALTRAMLCGESAECLTLNPYAAVGEPGPPPLPVASVKKTLKAS